MLTISDFRGGIGRQLFQYASLYGIAVENSMTPTIVSEKNFRLSQFFPDLSIPRGCSVFGKFDIREFRGSQGYKPLYFDDIECSANTALSGDFMTWRHFDLVKHEIQVPIKLQTL